MLGPLTLALLLGLAAPGANDPGGAVAPRLTMCIVSISGTGLDGREILKVRRALAATLKGLGVDVPQAAKGERECPRPVV